MTRIIYNDILTEYNNIFIKINERGLYNQHGHICGSDSSS